MNTLSFASASGYEPSSLPTSPPEERQRQGTPPNQPTRQPRFDLIRWIQQNTFAPQWLPEPLRHPLIGYLAATLVELGAVSLSLLILSHFPTFAFSPIFTLTAVVLIALGWGAGPGLLATVLGTLLLEYVVQAPQFSWAMSDSDDVVGLVLYLLLGISISLLAGRSERARRQAETISQLLAEAEARSRFESERLRTILDVLPTPVLIVSSEGQLLEMNQATRTLWGDNLAPGANITPSPANKAWQVRTGQLLSPEAWPLVRTLSAGQVVQNDELEIETLDGQRKVILNSTAPLRDETGTLRGAVMTTQDISEHYRLEQRTREILGAVVAMAEATVQIRPSALPVEAAAEVVVEPRAQTVLSVVATRLAEVTRSVLGCRRVSIAAVNSSTGLLDPVTQVGLSPEHDHAWWSSWSSAQRLEERYSRRIAEALAAGEPALLDAQTLPEGSRHLLFGAQSGQIMPMRLGSELVGILTVDYSVANHDYATAEETLLTKTLARLGALVLEQDRLLHRWTEARANELALSETKAQMDTFLGIASHELKTPLTSLKLSVQIAERRLRRLVREKDGELSGSNAGLQPSLEEISRMTYQVQRLERLVNDLVDVARIEAGKLELRLDQADLVTIVREVVDMQQLVAPERTIQLQCAADLSIPVYVDAGRIEQVVTNFLTNALKYSPADRPVDVGVQVEPRQAHVWVRDQGPGLPLEEQEHIWERFHRAKGVEVLTGGGIGLGLGLYISRMIVERHQGQVGVESVSGQGSTFWFTLPLPSPGEQGQ